ncbi:MAG: hypothetical protein DI598_01625 [Pseudopedobacter saltans]|uniref:Uncharacterized protein n=1 Tax=Pseudopedobacter saltans TaxID=151895 RepID=A0A2W5FAW4_9SPHI|nr:MAG: hypothetical protein DI598_01625 [Pseudopedobacter saltans]
MKYINKPYSVFADGSAGYDVKKAVLVLNRKGIGKNNFLYYLRKFGFLNEQNRATEEYKSKCFCDKLSLKLSDGRLSWRVCVSDKFMEYLKSEGVFARIEKEDVQYCLDTFGTEI